MVVRIDYGDGRSDFYEGEHVGFFPWERTTGHATDAKGTDILIEGKKGSITIGVEKGLDVNIYLMNDQGKTIEKTFV